MCRPTTIFSNITIDGHPGAELLLADLAKDEDLVAILRGQLYVESSLDRMLDQAVPKWRQLVNNFSFGHKCAALKRLGLITSETSGQLTVLGTLRNRFAHNLHKQLDESDANELLASLDFQHRDWIDSIATHNPAARSAGSMVRLAIMCIWLDLEFASNGN